MFFYDKNNPERLWIHLHGFATDISGSKIEFARLHFSKTKSFSFYAMDMNYETHTTTEILEVMEALILGFSESYKHITLCGSSHGAYIVANLIRFKRLGNTRSVLLLAPSFETLSLIVKEFGEEKTKNWLKGKEKLKIKEEDKEIEIREDFATDIIENNYEIIKGNEVYFPEIPPVDILIVHGILDEIVPIERSRLFAKKVKVKDFIEVEDNHQLSETFGKVLTNLVKEGKL